MTMKTLMCSLAVIVSVALSSAVFAGSEKYLRMTGTVVESPKEGPPGVIAIETAPKKYFSFHAEGEGAALKVSIRVPHQIARGTLYIQSSTLIALLNPRPTTAINCRPIFS
jgi:hypothetical protein